MVRKFSDFYYSPTLTRLGRTVRAAAIRVGWVTALLLVTVLLITTLGEEPLPAEAQGGSADHNGRPTVNYVIQLYIEEVRALDSVDGDGSAADFYAEGHVYGHKFNNEDKGNQDLLEGRNHIRPGWRFYRTIEDLRETRLPLVIRIFDEDGGFGGSDDHIDILPGEGRTHDLVLDITTCQVEGNIGVVRGRFAGGICRIHVGPIRGNQDDRAEIRYRIDFYNESTYYHPTFNGLRLDRCQFWGRRCGEPAARAWCQAYDSAFKYSTNHQVAHNVSPTHVIGDNRVCNGAGCDSFSSVTCTTNDFR